MSIIERMEKAYNCLEDYKSNCNSKEHKKFIDIFFPMLYQENKHRLMISIGKKISESKFNCALSMFSDDFIATLDYWNNDPLLTFKYAQNKYPITLINLASISNLKIETKKDKDVNFCSHDIYFRYNEEFDYNLHIVIED